jgi:hypothetical protein
MITQPMTSVSVPCSSTKGSNQRITFSTTGSSRRTSSASPV